MSTTHIPVDKGIEDLEIIEVKINREGHYEIYVENTQEGCTCHVCGKHMALVKNKWVM